MKNAAAFRITMHACLFFSAAFIIPPLIPENGLGYGVIAALILLSSLAAAYTKPAALRVLIALIPFAGLLLVPRTPAALIVGALPCVYAAIPLISGKLFFEHWQFLRELKGVLIAVGVLIAAFALVSLIRVSLVTNGTIKDPAFVPVHYDPIPYLIAAVVLGFLALRCARAGNIKSTRWQLGNVGFFALPLSLAIAAGIALNTLLGSIDLLTPINNLAASIASCSTVEQAPTPRPTPYPRERTGRQLIEASFNPEEWEYSPDAEAAKPKGSTISEKKVGLGLLYALGAVLGGALITVLILRARRIEADDAVEDDVERGEAEDSLIDRIFKGNRRGRKVFSNAGKVREVYRRYITFLRMQGIQPHAGTTSAELSAESRKLLLDESPDELLRSLYLRARYEGAELTDEDALLAEQAFDRIVEKSNSKKENTEN